MSIKHWYFPFQTREGQKCKCNSEDPHTMHGRCCQSRGCFSVRGRVTGCRAYTPGWTNWFVPSGVHLERGHCYGMHTSPWRSPVSSPHLSPPLSAPVSAAPDLFTFTSVFQRSALWIPKDCVDSFGCVRECVSDSCLQYCCCFLSLMRN